MKRTDNQPEIVKEEEKVCGNVIYRYRLIRAKSLKVASYLMPLYSIHVSLTRDGITTENSLENVFSDIGKALVFFEQISKNLATPADLPYILEDKISL